MMPTAPMMDAARYFAFFERKSITHGSNHSPLFAGSQRPPQGCRCFGHHHGLLWPGTGRWLVRTGSAPQNHALGHRQLYPNRQQRQQARCRQNQQRAVCLQPPAAIPLRLHQAFCPNHRGRRQNPVDVRRRPEPGHATPAGCGAQCIARRTGGLQQQRGRPAKTVPARKRPGQRQAGMGQSRAAPGRHTNQGCDDRF